MPLLSLSIKHGQSYEEAKQRLDLAVREIQSRFGAMVDRVEWSTDRTEVKLFGKGVELEMRIDAENVHVTGDIPALGGLLGGVFRRGLESVVKTTFRKGLPSK